MAISIRNLISRPWRRRDISKDEPTNVHQHPVYIVKWVPTDQEVIIDHFTRYHNPAQAMQFATNVLVLKPKRIWIENGEGAIHTDYDVVLRSAHRSAKAQALVANTRNDAGPEVGIIDFIREPIITETEARPVFEDGNETGSRDPAGSNTIDEQINERDQESKIRIVIAEIHCLLVECSGAGDRSSEPATQPQTTAAILPDRIGRKLIESEKSDPVRVREIEVLLGIAA